MAAYSYYIQDYYGDAIAQLLDSTKYPNHKNIDYANYLHDLFYEQIVDEKDLQSINNAKENFNLVIKNYLIQICFRC